MSESQKTKFLSTTKKDEAAFYLSELARGLLRNRISICLGKGTLVMTSFDWIHLEIQALEKEDGTAVDIHLSWRKAPPGIALGSPDRESSLDSRDEGRDRPALHTPQTRRR